MQVMVEVVMEAVVDEEVDNIVGKCQIFYTDQYQQTRFYPEKSACVATFLALQTYKTELMGFLVMNKCG